MVGTPEYLAPEVNLIDLIQRFYFWYSRVLIFKNSIEIRNLMSILIKIIFEVLLN